MSSWLFTDVNEAFPVLWHQMMARHSSHRHWRNSRNGKTVEFTNPCTITYQHPRRRVLFHPVRDCNPFFHLFEAIWMLDGRSTVHWLAQFNPRMMEYSDDGKTLYGAYGKRWWRYLPHVIEHLRDDPDTRRAYLPIFEPADVTYDGLDMPCNVGVAFNVRNGYLDATVFNRSNDMLWGALGANYVHFGFLQEYVAIMSGYRVGYLTQISSNFHLYLEFEVTKKLMGNVQPMEPNPYETDNVPLCLPILQQAYDEEWRVDAEQFIDIFAREDEKVLRPMTWREPFFEKVAVPMFCAWHAWRHTGDLEEAIDQLEGSIGDMDWKRAAREWLGRRAARRKAYEPVAAG